MSFLVIFVIAVIIVGALVILINVRAIRAEAERGGVDHRDRPQTATTPGEPVGAAAPDTQVAEIATGAPARPAASSGLDPRSPFAGGPGLPAPEDEREPEVPQMTDDDYRAAIRAIALGTGAAQQESRKDEPDRA
ncbi:MAG: hypothetical protein IRZ10_10280 [Thermoflavifilum sp.]|nr:hypothetical protein [Thermoflavifilum sp.]MCL6514795.1 hypothetical protein [Alicyclobacillus sp.]